MHLFHVQLYFFSSGILESRFTLFTGAVAFFRFFDVFSRSFVRSIDG